MSEGRQTATARGERDRHGRPRDAARKRAAAEIVVRHEAALKRTARRYSLNAEDAEDAYQRALEIVLTKAPTTDLGELIRWTQTVTKHEALAVRQGRERLLGFRPRRERDAGGPDPIAQIPVSGDGPDELVQRREAIARSREALRALKPAELRALTLLAEGYSYAEIGEITGFSGTKVNRLLAEGRERFRGVLSSSEDGSRCRELRPLLSAFCDGEVGPVEGDVVRAHLRACGRCRATMRAYRAAPKVALGLAPALPAARSLLERAHDLLASIPTRLPGSGGDGAATGQIAAGGVAGSGMAGVGKLLALCAAAAGGAACLATGVVPTPLQAERQRVPAVVHGSERSGAGASETPTTETPPPPREPVRPKPKTATPPPPEPAQAPGEASGDGSIEYEAPPAPAAPPPAPAPASETEASSPSGSAAGEFGP